jgi:hypothetical protein
VSKVEYFKSEQNLSPLGGDKVKETKLIPFKGEVWIPDLITSKREDSSLA